jgi:CheY-like chemotaxis protein
VPAAPLRPPAAVNGASNGAEPVRVLLVEDHAATRLTLAQLLRHRRYDVTSAASANEALRHAQAQAFDLVISDVGLPDRNGYELMGDLRRIDPQLGGIALSGYGMEEDIARSQAAGFAVHLVKPVTMARLEEAIARLLPTDAAAKNGGNPPSA